VNAVTIKEHGDRFVNGVAISAVGNIPLGEVISKLGHLTSEQSAIADRSAPPHLAILDCGLAGCDHPSSRMNNSCSLKSYRRSWALHQN